MMVETHIHIQTCFPFFSQRRAEIINPKAKRNEENNKLKRKKINGKFQQKTAEKFKGKPKN